MFTPSRTNTSVALALMLSAFFVFPDRGRAQKIDFRNQVLPILKSRCFECHGAPTKTSAGRKKRVKGGLRLDGKGWILLGGDGGKVLSPQDAKRSSLYTRTVLDREDPDIMPAKGKPLSSKETGLLRQWIEQGADFGAWKGDTGAEIPKASSGKNSTKNDSRELIQLLDKLGAKLPFPEQKALIGARDSMGRIVPAIPGSPLLRVDFISKENKIQDVNVEKLASVKGNITQLGLGRTRITDESLKVIGKMSRLTRLDLNNTEISDAGVAHLSPLTELRYLNLYGTSVTNQGLSALSSLSNLRSLYLFETQVTDEGTKQLQTKLPGLKIHLKPDLSSLPTGDGQGRRRRRR